MYKITIETNISGIRKEPVWRKLHDKQEFDNKLDPQYGYVAVELPYKENKTIYEQTVSEINLVKVIEAVNNMQKENK